MTIAYLSKAESSLKQRFNTPQYVHMTKNIQNIKNIMSINCTDQLYGSIVLKLLI
jgi:hypothetical protein